MLTGLWNSLAGYVIIELEGKALERLLNRLVHSGIEIWHIRRTGTDTITAYISVATNIAYITNQIGKRYIR